MALKIPLCCASYAIVFADFLDRIGAPTERGLERHKLPPDVREKPGMLVSPWAQTAFAGDMARREGIDDFGLLVPTGKLIRSAPWCHPESWGEGLLLGQKPGIGRLLFSCLAPLLLMLVAGVIFVPHPSLAGGPVHGARAAGMGTAFIAVADDPSAILHNPGGLTQVEGTQFYGGATGVILHGQFEGQSGARDETDSQLFLPPHLYATTDFGTDRWVFALGFHSPLGIGGRKWSRDGPLRYANTESGIATFALNPTVAWQVSENLSLAIGIDYLRADSKSERMVDQSMFGADDARFKLEGDGYGWGFNVGLLYRLNEQLRLGLAYRSGIKVGIDGEAKIGGIAPPLQPAFGGNSFKTDADTTLDFPEIYGFGLAYDPGPQWTVAVDIEWVRWSSFDKIETNFRDEVPAAGIGDTTTTLDWKDSWLAKIGFEYRADGGFSLRGGYAYVLTPVPEKSFEPGNPDADSHNFHIGCGYRRQKWNIDGFYALGVFEDRTVRNELVNGQFENTAHYVGISVGNNF